MIEQTQTDISQSSCALERYSSRCFERIAKLRAICAPPESTTQGRTPKKIGWSVIVMVALIGGCVGNQVGHQTVAAECERLGAFYVGGKVFKCETNKP